MMQMGRARATFMNVYKNDNQLLLYMARAPCWFILGRSFDSWIFALSSIIEETMLDHILCRFVFLSPLPFHASDNLHLYCIVIFLAASFIDVRSLFAISLNQNGSQQTDIPFGFHTSSFSFAAISISCSNTR